MCLGIGKISLLDYEKRRVVEMREFLVFLKNSFAKSKNLRNRKYIFFDFHQTDKSVIEKKKVVTYSQKNYRKKICKFFISIR